MLELLELVARVSTMSADHGVHRKAKQHKCIIALNSDYPWSYSTLQHRLSRYTAESLEDLFHLENHTRNNYFSKAKYATLSRKPSTVTMALLEIISLTLGSCYSCHLPNLDGIRTTNLSSRSQSLTGKCHDRPPHAVLSPSSPPPKSSPPPLGSLPCISLLK